MANTFITPSVIASRGLATLYNSTVLGNLVWRDFDPDFTGKQGDTVTIRKPAIFTAEEFDRDSGVEYQDATEDSTDVSLDTVANVSFEVTDEQMTLDISDFENQLLVPAMEAIVQKVDGDLAAALLAAAQAESQVSTLSSVASDAVIGARTILSDNKFPTSDRYAVFSPAGTGVALSDELFVQANKSGSTDALREANLGRVFGIDTYESQVFTNGGGIAFHKSAVTLAVRPLGAPRGLPSNQVAVESYKGLSLRTTYAYDHSRKSDLVSCDLLYGIADTRPEGAVEVDLGAGS